MTKSSGNWINVKDSLPSVDEWVLAYCPYKDNVFKSRCKGKGKNGVVWWTWISGDYETKSYYPSHWQPMIELPKKEELPYPFNL